MVPYLGAGVRLRIIVGPATSLDGSVLEGFVYSDSGVPTGLLRSPGPDHALTPVPVGAIDPVDE